MKKRVLAIAATAMATMMMASPVMAQDFKIGICNYVDDASLNQIVDNIQSRLEEIGKEKDVNFDVSYDNCNADANVMEQIISDFQADNVDLMVANWVSRGERKIALPPNWLMPASNDTRVRVLDFSKIIPMTLPANGWNTSLLCCLRFSSIPRCTTWFSSKVDKSRKVRK